MSFISINAFGEKISKEILKSKQEIEEKGHEIKNKYLCKFGIEFIFNFVATLFLIIILVSGIIDFLNFIIKK